MGGNTDNKAVGLCSTATARQSQVPMAANIVTVIGNLLYCTNYNPESVYQEDYC